MDALVAQHGAPSLADENDYAEQQDELSLSTPSLSLKFAMPPVENVSKSSYLLSVLLANASPALLLAPDNDR